MIMSQILLAALLAISCTAKETPAPEPPAPVPPEFVISSPEHVSIMEKVRVKVSGNEGNEVSIDWGDGTSEKGDSTVFEHKYSSAGNYAVTAAYKEEVRRDTVVVGNLLALSEAVPALVAEGKVWVMAHRAHTSDPSIPENSIPAVNAAVAAGADVLETDTHITRDGVVVICHDQKVDATTDRKGDITKMTLAEIKACRLKDRNKKVTDETMPTLEEFLLTARDRAYVNIDYSPRTASAEQVMEIVEKLGMVQQVFLYCNAASKVEEVLLLNPEANVYSKHNCYTALPKVPNHYMIQARWYIDDEKTEEYAKGTAEAVRAGCVSTANMLHVLDEGIPEYSVDSTYLNSLFKSFPDCHMIQNDCPDILVPMLKEKGRR